jgi:hypothetical protein
MTLITPIYLPYYSLRLISAILNFLDRLVLFTNDLTTLIVVSIPPFYVGGDRSGCQILAPAFRLLQPK